jgi:ubiquinone/menaquinone biosynthesis C-methylase UbiE
MRTSVDDKILYEDEERWRKFTLSKYLQEKIDTIKSIIPGDTKTIIDIGCGNGLITNQLKNQFSIIGVDRSLSALKFVKVPKILGSIDALPIQNTCIDLIICSEVLEHLPISVFRMGINELDRITKKYVLVTVPNQEFLQKNNVICPKCKSVFNAAYHLRSFNLEILSKLFSGYKLIQHFECGKLVRQYHPFLLFIKNRIGKKWAHLGEDRWLTCPFCSERFLLKHDRNIISTITDALNKILSPRKPYWLGALFEKQI